MAKNTDKRYVLRVLHQGTSNSNRVDVKIVGKIIQSNETEFVYQVMKVIKYYDDYSVNGLRLSVNDKFIVNMKMNFMGNGQETIFLTEEEAMVWMI